MITLALNDNFNFAGRLAVSRDQPVSGIDMKDTFISVFITILIVKNNNLRILLVNGIFIFLAFLVIIKVKLYVFIR